MNAQTHMTLRLIKTDLMMDIIYGGHDPKEVFLNHVIDIDQNSKTEEQLEIQYEA